MLYELILLHYGQGVNNPLIINIYFENPLSTVGTIHIQHHIGLYTVILVTWVLFMENYPLI